MICKVKARGKFDISVLEEQDENVSPIVEVAYQEEEISTPNHVLTDIDIDDVNIIFNVDEEELNEMEIEELQCVLNGNQVIVDNEELEEELKDFESDEETQDEIDCDSNNSDSEFL
ncbi:probable DNA-directed RNA polymerase subunit delta [Zingiber officinale]|uniref:probable DNA-directed RNA polymerase subunit delta n=1 Tax=Zingiber officinale TaxID=94328 RepID=UPI001C4D1455|nr:probable DNA-directed RNA polymerase subunit delta [Zingiber officinale]